MYSKTNKFINSFLEIEAIKTNRDMMNENELVTYLRYVNTVLKIDLDIVKFLLMSNIELDILINKSDKNSLLKRI